MRIGIATDQGGFGKMEELLARRSAEGHEVVDFGAQNMAQMLKMSVNFLKVIGENSWMIVWIMASRV